jgi:hypothetical protein
MDELLKFLPILLYVLYRLFSSGKKKQPTSKPQKRKQERPKRTSTSTPSIEDILRELSGEPKQKEEPKPVPKPKQKRTRKPIEIVDHSKDLRVDYNHDADTGPSLQVLRSEMNKEKGLDNEKVEVDFDLRQAIINEAILNRPYD